MPQVWTCKFNSEHEWSNNYSNTNGVTKSPTAPQEAMVQLRRGTFVPWRVPVEKQQQQELVGLEAVQERSLIPNHKFWGWGRDLHEGIDINIFLTYKLSLQMSREVKVGSLDRGPSSKRGQDKDRMWQLWGIHDHASLLANRPGAHHGAKYKWDKLWAPQFWKR